MVYFVPLLVKTLVACCTVAVLKKNQRIKVLSFLNWLLVRTKDFESIMTLGEPVTP